MESILKRTRGPGNQNECRRERGGRRKREKAKIEEEVGEKKEEGKKMNKRR